MHDTKDIVKTVLSHLVENLDEGYARYKQRRKARRTVEDANFKVNQFRINWVLELIGKLINDDKSEGNSTSDSAEEPAGKFPTIDPTPTIPK